MVTIICKKLLQGLTAAGCDAVPGLAPNGPVSCLISCLATRKHQRRHFIRHQRCYSQVGGGKESGKFGFDLTLFSAVTIISAS